MGQRTIAVGPLHQSRASYKLIWWSVEMYLMHRCLQLQGRHAIAGQNLLPGAVCGPRRWAHPSRTCRQAACKPLHGAVGIDSGSNCAAGRPKTCAPATTLRWATASLLVPAPRAALLTRRLPAARSSHEGGLCSSPACWATRPARRATAGRRLAGLRADGEVRIRGGGLAAARSRLHTPAGAAAAS